LKIPVALKVLVWSRGLLVTIQILISSSFFLVEENSRLFGPMCLLFLSGRGEWFHCLRSFSFSFLSSDSASEIITVSLSLQMGEKHTHLAQDHMSQVKPRDTCIYARLTRLDPLVRKEEEL